VTLSNGQTVNAGYVRGATGYLQNGTTRGQMNYWDGSAWVKVQPGTNGQTLTFCNGVPQWGPCASSVANLPSVTIGTQIWSSKNLDVATYRNGDVIPQVTDPTAWANLTTGAWCWYRNDSANYAASYGRLYNWYAVNDPRGLAPAGWHVPSDAEWNKMTKLLDATIDTTIIGWVGTNIGEHIKYTSGWNNNGHGTNTSGFACLPGGFLNIDGSIGGAGDSGLWWSASEFGTENAIIRGLYYSTNYISRTHFNKAWGFSVRVVRD
jgi:uncharacterized protein (TIGR02145 family)